jgi:hypothetical protein
MKKKNAMAGFIAMVLFSFAAPAQNNAQAERITDGPQVKQVTATSAEIAWSTETPGSSIVRYGTNPNALSQTAQEPWGGKRERNGDYNHSVWVKNLTPNTPYYFIVQTGQGKGTGTGAQSQVQEFRTGAGR